MSKAVKFSGYGRVDVLHVVEVQRPQPGPGEVVESWPNDTPEANRTDHLSPQLLFGQCDELRPSSWLSCAVRLVWAHALPSPDRTRLRAQGQPA